MGTPTWTIGAKHSPTKHAPDSSDGTNRLAVFLDNVGQMPSLILGWQRVGVDPIDHWHVLHRFWQLPANGTVSYTHISGERITVTGGANAVYDYFGKDMVHSYLERGSAWIKSFFAVEAGEEPEDLEGVAIIYAALGETELADQVWKIK